MSKTKTEKANVQAKELDKEAKAEDAPAGDGSFDHTPTAPQIQTTAPANIVSSPEGVDTKTVKFEAQSGDPGGPKTTIVEEARILEPGEESEDRAETIRTMAVLAHSQGINQVKVLGQKKNDAGVKCDEVLTVFQNGTHSVDLVPAFDKDPD